MATAKHPSVFVCVICLTLFDRSSPRAMPKACPRCVPGWRSERQRASSRAYYSRNPVKCGDLQRRYVAANREVVLAKKRDAMQRLRDRDPERVRLYKNARRVGITPAQYLALIANGCAVCGTKTARLCIDHDHRCCPGLGSCGECIRGCLCNRHNRLAGYANDDPAELRAIAAYLERPRQLSLLG